MKISALLIDDDPDSRLVIRDYIERKFPDIFIAGEADSVAGAIQLIGKQTPDFLLLDISLPDGTAFDLLKQLPDKNFEIIFITAFGQYAIEAFRCSAVDYLLKPVAYKELDEALNKISERMGEKYFSKHWAILAHNIQQQNHTDKKLAIATPGGYVFIDTGDIHYLESHGNYTHCFTAEGKKHVSAKTLGFYEELLPVEKFIRIHHSHIINVDYVDRFNREGAEGEVVLKDGTRLAVSQRKKDDFLKSIGLDTRNKARQ